MKWKGENAPPELLDRSLRRPPVSRSLHASCMLYIACFCIPSVHGHHVCVASTRNIRRSLFLAFQSKGDGGDPGGHKVPLRLHGAPRGVLGDLGHGSGHQQRRRGRCGHAGGLARGSLMILVTAFVVVAVNFCLCCLQSAGAPRHRSNIGKVPAVPRETRDTLPAGTQQRIAPRPAALRCGGPLQACRQGS